MNRLAITQFDPLDYSTNEALNTLCTNISFAGTDVKRIMLTSCRAREGKSFMSMNLMRSLAGIGKRVVLVDADLRRSVLSSRYGIQAPKRQPGLTHYLAGLCSMDSILCSTDIDGAFMIMSGQDVANSLSLLSSKRMPALLKELGNLFDVVLVDAPPVGVIIDAAQIAKSCDGVLFVVSDNQISRKELKEATEQIARTGCPILGAVLNMVSFSTHSSKKYYYKHYYSHYAHGYYDRKSEPKKKPQARRASAATRMKRD